MKPWPWLAGGLGLYAVALAVLAPAWLLDAALDDASAGRLRLASPEGTVWSGRATAELRDDGGGRRWSAPLSWRWQPAALLAGRLDYRLGTGPAASLSAVSVTRSRVEFSGVDIRMPAARLAEAIPALAPWGVGGELQLRADRLAFGPAHAAGGFTVHWRAAGSTLSPVSPLGDYALEVEGRDQAWRARLHTLAGPLQLDGHGGWRSGDRPAFEATAVVPAPLRDQLAPFLRMVAIERGEGRFEWRLQ